MGCCKGKIDFFCASDQFQNDPVLNGCKPCEAVKNDHAVTQRSCVWNRLGQEIQRLLGGHILILFSLPEGGVQELQIAESGLQGDLAVLPGIIRHPLDLFLFDPVLHKFGQDRFDLIDHTRTVDPPVEDLEFPCAAGGNTAQQQAFADVIQNRAPVRPGFFKDPVGKTAEAQNINIHQHPGRMIQNQIPLSLHGVLFRYDDDISCPVILAGSKGSVRLLDDHLSQQMTLSGARRPKTK